MGSVADDRWHVRMAPGEVKVLTLDQIDDLFRLEMIDGDTLVRQDGTDQWLPLSVVAGLDDEASEPVPPARSAAPPAPSAPPPVRSAPPPPPAPLPPPAPAPFTHSPSFVPPPASTAARAAPHSAPPPIAPAPSAPAPSYRPPIVAPIAPLAFTPPLPMASPRASRSESLLIASVALLGLVLALQRNGALATLFASAGQAAAYAKLESALGGPGFGTPRAVDALTSPTRAAPGRR